MSYRGGRAEDQPSALAEARAAAASGVVAADGEQFAYADEGLPVQVQTYTVEDKVGRNDPCPCGSGKKFKKCHGA